MKRLNLLFLLIFLFASCSEEERTVALLGQWHLLSKASTIDIEKGKSLAQFPNQTSIYLMLKEWIEQKKIDTILAEGCEGELTSNFKPNFNGWTFESLKSKSKDQNYSAIMTHIPLKLKAEFGDKIKVICADNLDTIRHHQSLFSDLKGYFGFYTRIKQSLNGDKKKGKAYLSALEDNEKKTIAQPLAYLKKKIVKLVNDENEMIKKRNELFLNQIDKYSSRKVAVVIGYRHLAHLNNQLKEKKIKTFIPQILVDTLPEEDLIQELLSKLKTL
ncbi:hypothetical protein N9N67_02125 [Bacteriovoracaceae bacterium]|nr:hypothetical protein [Bacteriovoracaceae bacterium]